MKVKYPLSLVENVYDVIMTSPFVQFFENVNFPSSYMGLSAHQIWLNLGQGKQSYGGGRIPPPPQVENVLNRPGEIGLTYSYLVYNNVRMSSLLDFLVSSLS